MKKIFLSLLIIFAVFVFSCSKDEISDVSTSIELTVLDDDGYPVSDANVTFYLYDNYLSNNGISIANQTDYAGKVIFYNLQPGKYIWFVEKDCMNNLDNLSYVSILSGEHKFTVNLKSYGQIDFENNSDNSYRIYINDEPLYDLPGKKYLLKNIQTGTYTIRLLQLDGYLFYPTELIYEVNISCGNIAIINFP